MKKRVTYILLKDNTIVKIKLEKDFIPFLIRPYFVKEIKPKLNEAIIDEQEFYRKYYAYNY